jgi:hypothetical protein
MRSRRKGTLSIDVVTIWKFSIGISFTGGCRTEKEDECHLQRVLITVNTTHPEYDTFTPYFFIPI